MEGKRVEGGAGLAQPFLGDLRDIGTGNQARLATIEVTVIEARNLKAADWNGTSDPYVSVKYGNVKQRSKVSCPLRY